MLADQSRDPCVLVAEEEEAIRDLLQMMLQARGFSVLLAATGQEALELYMRRAGEIDVVLIDMGMTGMDGRQTLTALRQLAPSLPCCFMTGGAVGEQFPELGVTRVFSKPFSLDDVSDNLWRVAGGYRRSGQAPDR